MESVLSLAKNFNRDYIRGNEYLPIEVVISLLESNRISVDTYKFRVDKFSGMLMYDQLDEQHTIVVNRNHNTGRRLFTIAHELGHYFLHREIQEEFVCNEMFKGKFPIIEIQANAFAAELIMPEPIMMCNLANGCTLSALANKLQVSFDAIRWRYVYICEKHIKGLTPQDKQLLIETLFDEKHPDRLLFPRGLHIGNMRRIIP